MLPELRPRGIGEILDTGVSLFRARVGRLLGLTALVIVPVQVLSTLVLLSAQPDNFSVNFNGSVSPQYDSRSATTQFAANIVVLFVNFLSTAFVTAVCTRVVADAYVGNDESAAASARMAGRRFFAIVGVGILTALAQMAGALACGIGIIAPITFFAVAVPALILEGVGVTAAMGRSFTLTKTHFWRVLGLYVAAHLLGFIVNIGLAVGLAAGFRHGDSATTLIISQGIASAIATVLTTPFVATAIVACYFDLRIRDEGFDIQLMLQRLNAKYAPPPPPPPPPPPQPAYVQ